MTGKLGSLSLILMLLSSAPAQAQTAGEDRLRAALKQTTLDLRAAQEQLAGAKAENEALKAAAEVAAKAPPVPTVDPRLQATLAAQTRELEALKAEAEAGKQSLAKWQAAYQEAAEVARSRDVEIRRLTEVGAKSAAAEQVCVAKNRELVDIGQQLLTSYRNKGVFASLAAAEPITGLARVRYETLAQEYGNRIAAQKLPEAP